MPKHDERYKVLRRKLANLKKIIDMELEGKIDLPNDVTILTLDDTEKTEIFTKKRMELLKVIQRKKPKSIRSLAKLVKRKIEAVSRDLAILKRYHIIEEKRKKSTLMPILNKKLIVMPLIEAKPIKKMVEVCR